MKTTSRYKVYALGYAGRTISDIETTLRELDEEAILVDVRLAPYSSNPSFKKSALESKFGSRYVHFKEFGNRNYRGPHDDPVELVDYNSGREKLAYLISEVRGGGIKDRGCGDCDHSSTGVDMVPKAAVLMCGCRDAASCHRTVILAMLKEDGFDSVELG